MAKDNFETALNSLLRHEGGYSNHPSDRGGPTKFGITLADYRKYVKADAVAADVKAMPVQAARVIYRARYWNALRCDALPMGVDYAVFDYGVNSGVSRSAKVLRRLLGLAGTAGGVSDDMIAAARSAKATDLITALCDERLRFLMALQTWPVFGRGWARRIVEVRRAALSMAQAPPPPTLNPVPPEPAARGLFHALTSFVATLLKGVRS